MVEMAECGGLAGRARHIPRATAFLRNDIDYQPCRAAGGSAAAAPQDAADHAGNLRALVAEAGPSTRRRRGSAPVSGGQAESGRAGTRSNLTCTGFVPADLDN